MGPEQVIEASKPDVAQSPISARTRFLDRNYARFLNHNYAWKFNMVAILIIVTFGILMIMVPFYIQRPTGLSASDSPVKSPPFAPEPPPNGKTAPPIQAPPVAAKTEENLPREILQAIPGLYDDGNGTVTIKIWVDNRLFQARDKAERELILAKELWKQTFRKEKRYICFTRAFNIPDDAWEGTIDYERIRPESLK